MRGLKLLFLLLFKMGIFLPIKELLKQSQPVSIHALDLNILRGKQ